MVWVWVCWEDPFMPWEVTMAGATSIQLRGLILLTGPGAMWPPWPIRGQHVAWPSSTTSCMLSEVEMGQLVSDQSSVTIHIPTSGAVLPTCVRGGEGWQWVCSMVSCMQWVVMMHRLSVILSKAGLILKGVGKGFPGMAWRSCHLFYFDTTLLKVY